MVALTIMVMVTLYSSQNPLKVGAGGLPDLLGKKLEGGGWGKARTPHCQWAREMPLLGKGQSGSQRVKSDLVIQTQAGQ